MPIDVDNTFCNLPLTKLPFHGIPSSRPPLHHSSFFLHLSIVDALKLTKSGRRSKSNLTIIDFDSIDVCDVKYLLFTFDGDVLFVLPPFSMVVLSACGRAMDGIDKMYDGHS